MPLSRRGSAPFLIDVFRSPSRQVDPPHQREPQSITDALEPIEKNLYERRPEEAVDVKSVPGSLDQKLDALKQDHDRLLAGDVFTNDVIRAELERKHELDAIRLGPHPWEFALYFDT